MEWGAETGRRWIGSERERRVWGAVCGRRGGGEEAEGGGRKRAGSRAGSLKGGVKDEEDEDRVDARNAASRLATSTF